MLAWFQTDLSVPVHVNFMNFGYGNDHQPVDPKGNQSWILEELMLKLKLQYFGHLMQRPYFLEKTDSDAGKDWRQMEKRVAEDEMVR